MKREEFIEKWGLYENGAMYADLNELLSLPPAEGAEEILNKYILDQTGKTIWKTVVFKKDALFAMQEFATLHAQRIADKMVSERLRGELIAFDLFSNVSETPPHDDDDIEVATKAAEKYLKSKKHG